MTEYRYITSPFIVTDDMKRTFDRDGYIIIRNLLSQSEVEKATKVVECNETMKRFKFGVKDTHGNESAQITWNQPGNDVTGLIARCDKVSGTAEKLLGGECYHYHSKVVLKDPLAGGERAWHQDYGYWYQNGCLFPDMLTVFITLDKTDQSNGCLQLLRGSHQCGRIEHTLVGAETGAKMERVNELLKKCPLDFIETEPAVVCIDSITRGDPTLRKKEGGFGSGVIFPLGGKSYSRVRFPWGKLAMGEILLYNTGDGVFFHCNLLHMSAVNASNRRRLAFLVAYNKASNNPVKEHHHPQYTPLKKVPDAELEHCDVLDDMNGKSFLDMENSKTLKDQTSFKKRQ